MQAESANTRLFLAGDVMAGRGIDQVLASPGSPRLHEPYVRDARDYVKLAEAENGRIGRRLDDDYIWGDALALLDEAGPDVRIVNLETAVTARGEPWPGKQIHYRMHPANAGCLSAGGIDCCALANNHLLDWGRTGLVDTLDTLEDQGITACGAGPDFSTAAAPAALPVDHGRLLVFSCGHGSSGIPEDWAAQKERSGVWRLDDLSGRTIEQVARVIEQHRQPGDRVIVSIHIGGNWGYAVDRQQQQFARALVDTAGVDLLHGHSSHHPRPLEVHNGRLILYGCGDLINDYEGISGHDEFRPELVAMYFPELEADGRLSRLEIVPMRMHRFRLERVEMADAHWMAETLNRQGHEQACRLEVTNAGTLVASNQDVSSKTV